MTGSPHRVIGSTEPPVMSSSTFMASLSPPPTAGGSRQDSDRAASDVDEGLRMTSVEQAELSVLTADGHPAVVGPWVDGELGRRAVQGQIGREEPQRSQDAFLDE